MRQPVIQIDSLPTEISHEGTTTVRRLIRQEENRPGRIATMNYAVLPPEKQLTVHKHADGEEFYIFLEGNGRILVDDTWHQIKQESFVAIPKAANHSVHNTGNVDLVFLTVRTVET